MIQADSGDFRRINRHLRAAAPELRKRFRKEIREIVKPVVAAQRAKVNALPTHGKKHTGLRRKVAATVRIEARYSGDRMGVRVRTEGSRMPGDLRRIPKRMNRGGWRHPVFGTSRWVRQDVPAGWFDDPAKDAAPRVQEQMNKTLRDWAMSLSRRT